MSSVVVADALGSVFQGVRPGVGVELQARYRRGGPRGLTVAAGFQSTGHPGPSGSVRVKAIFVEPRLAFGPDASARPIPYVSGRFSIVRQRSAAGVAGGKALGGGVGVLLQVSSIVEIDMAANVALMWFSPPWDLTGNGATMSLRVGTAVLVGQ